MTGRDRDRADGNRHSISRVREVYDAIAAHFSKTREFPWPEVESFLGAVPAGGRGLDVGCGNGRHTEVLAARTDSVVGVDVSRRLLFEARDRSGREGWDCALVQGDAAALPIASRSVDVAVYVATLHHLPTAQQRRRSLEELGRVLRPGGRALVSAWSTAHDRFEATADAREGFDTTVDWTLPDGETIPRFYHIYAPAEFEAELNASGLDVEDWYLSSGNCYAEVASGGDRREGKHP